MRQESYAQAQKSGEKFQTLNLE